MTPVSTEVSRHITLRGARRAAATHAHRVHELGGYWAHAHIQVRRRRGVRRWAVIER